MNELKSRGAEWLFIIISINFSVIKSVIKCEKSIDHTDPQLHASALGSFQGFSRYSEQRPARRPPLTGRGGASLAWWGSKKKISRGTKRAGEQKHKPTKPSVFFIFSLRANAQVEVNLRSLEKTLQMLTLFAKFQFLLSMFLIFVWPWCSSVASVLEKKTGPKTKGQSLSFRDTRVFPLD